MLSLMKFYIISIISWQHFPHKPYHKNITTSLLLGSERWRYAYTYTYKVQQFRSHKACGTDLLSPMDDVPTTVIGVDGVKEMGPVQVKPWFECIRGG